VGIPDSKTSQFHAAAMGPLAAIRLDNSGSIAILKFRCSEPLAKSQTSTNPPFAPVEVEIGQGVTLNAKFQKQRTW
jgi:hypothetical protein